MAKQSAPPAPPPAPAPAPVVPGPAAPVVPPAPTAAQQLEQARFAAALAHVTTEGPDGSAVPPVHAAQRPANLPPGVPWDGRAPVFEPPAAPAPNLPYEDPSIVAHRAMLAEEEKRLQLLRARNPVPQIPDVTPLPHSHLSGAQQRAIVVREGADPLHVEAFQVLGNLVAGGLVAPGYDKRPLLALLQKLEAAVQYVPAAVSAPAAPDEKK